MRAAVDLEISELVSDSFEGVSVGIRLDFYDFSWVSLVDFGGHVSVQVSLEKVVFKKV